MVEKSAAIGSGLVKVRINDGQGGHLQHHFVRVQRWGLPSGRIEKGETPIQAAARELLERTGYKIDTKNLRPVGVDQKGFHVFEGDKKNTQLVAKPGELGGYSTKVKWAKGMKKMAAVATKTDPGKWEQAKRDAKARMGGKHSARAMQLATQLYKKRGGGYSGAKPTAKSNSLKKWTKQKWKWSGGDKKGQGGKGVYLPSKKVDRLKSTRAGRKALSSASRKKSKATREGRQYSSHGLAAGTSLRKTAMKNSAESLAKHILGPKAKVNDVLTADMPAARKRKILAKMREMRHKKKTANPNFLKAKGRTQGTGSTEGKSEAEVLGARLKELFKPRIKISDTVTFRPTSKQRKGPNFRGAALEFKF